MEGREVIFIADDLGTTPAVNEAIQAAHQHGALQGASLMMGQPATAEAVTMAQSCPGLQIGWHLHLCDSVPLTRPNWPWGRSPLRAGWSIGLLPSARRLMRAEVAAQWQAFRETGLAAAFINSHHHLHAHPVVWRTVQEIVGDAFDGWVRLGDVRRFDAPAHGPAAWSLLWRQRRSRCRWSTSDTLWGIDRLHAMQAREIRQVIPQLPAGRHEFIFHPRAIDDDADLCALKDLRP